MSATVSVERIADVSPRFKARMAGALYFVAARRSQCQRIGGVPRLEVRDVLFGPFDFWWNLRFSDHGGKLG